MTAHEFVDSLTTDQLKFLAKQPLNDRQMYILRVLIPHCIIIHIAERFAANKISNIEDELAEIERLDRETN